MKIGFYWKKRNILREETWDFRCCYTDFSTDFSFQAKSISDTSRRPFNASGGVTALLLNNPNNNLENFDKCPVACGYATKVSKVTHSLHSQSVYSSLQGQVPIKGQYFDAQWDIWSLVFHRKTRTICDVEHRGNSTSNFFLSSHSTNFYCVLFAIWKRAAEASTI